LTHQPVWNPKGYPKVAGSPKRSADPRNPLIKDSHPESVPPQLCDPFRVKTQLLFWSGGIAALNPRLLSRSPKGCLSLIQVCDYMIPQVCHCAWNGFAFNNPSSITRDWSHGVS